MPMTNIRSKLLGKRRFCSERLTALVGSCSAWRTPRRSASAATHDHVTKERARTKPLPGKFPGAETYVSMKGSVCKRRFGTAPTRREDVPWAQTDWCIRSC